MINLVQNKLSELGLKVNWQLRPKDFPSLTFLFVNESGLDFADDEEVTTEFICQVDVWSKNDYTDIVNQVKEKMKEIGFYRFIEYDDLEEDTKIYHKIIRFSYVKENREG